MEIKCFILAGIMLVAGFGLGFVVNNMFFGGSRGQRSQLLITDVEWSFEGDFLTMYITVDNIGTMPVTVDSISVRKNIVGSTEYVDSNPIGINSGSNDIAAGGAETFEWNATKGSAPVDFLLLENTYVVKVTVYDGFFERTTIAFLAY